MRYRIIGDSCCDYTAQETSNEVFASVPLTLQVDQFYIIDDNSFDQLDFLKKVAEGKDCPRSACPAPEDYMRAYESAEDIYVVTLSAELSGSYNSAVLAQNLYVEEKGKKNIHIFNSCAASSAQLLICRKIYELAESGLPFGQVVEEVEKYIGEQHTYFVLETLDFLRKNGRLSKVQAILAGALNIKPVMGATPEGEIFKLSQVRGMKKALLNMLDYVVKEGGDLTRKSLIIAHCNCQERAEWVKSELLKKAGVGRVDVVDTRGVSSLYAGDGGIIIAC